MGGERGRIDAPRQGRERPGTGRHRGAARRCSARKCSVRRWPRRSSTTACATARRSSASPPPTAGTVKRSGASRFPKAWPERSPQYRAHPAILDACLQVIMAALPREAALSGAGPYLPVHIDRIHLSGPLTGPVWSHVRVRHAAGRTLVADLAILDEAGTSRHRDRRLPLPGAGAPALGGLGAWRTNGCTARCGRRVRDRGRLRRQATWRRWPRSWPPPRPSPRATALRTVAWAGIPDGASPRTRSPWPG